MDMRVQPLHPKYTPDAGNIRIEGEASQRFYQMLCQALDANEALATSVDSFAPPMTTGPGFIDAALAVEAYSKIVRERLKLALAIIEGEDDICAADNGGQS